jgi:hypothetical protein
VIRDDRQVHELLVQKREAAAAKRPASLPDAVAEALASAPELVHVVVRTLPSEDEQE